MSDNQSSQYSPTDTPDITIQLYDNYNNQERQSEFEFKLFPPTQINHNFKGEQHDIFLLQDIRFEDIPEEPSYLLNDDLRITDQ